MALTSTDLMPAVERGAAWLDSLDPAWFTWVDLRTLWLGHCEHCPLGQIFGDYEAVMERMFPDDSVFASRSPAQAWSNAHGFSLFDRGICGSDAEWATLTECWVTVILQRQFHAQQQQTLVTR